MAINSNKFLALPPSKSSSLVVDKKTGIIKSDKIFEKPKEKAKESNKSNKLKIDSRLLRIEKKVINIDNLLKDFLSIQKNKFKQQSKKQEEKNRQNREKELEKNVKKPSGVKLPEIPKPKLGLFDWIKNFISNVILGFIAIRLIDQLPQLAKLIPIINGVMNFIIDWGGKLLNGLVTFIDWGYKAVDASRGFVSNVFGESGAKAFDNFANKFNDVIKYSLIAAMLISSAGDDIIGGFGGGKPAGSGGSSGPYKYDQKRSLIRKKYGDSFAKLYDQEIAKGLNSEQARKNVLSRYVKKGRITPQRMTGSLGGTDTGSRILGRGASRAPQRLAIKGLTATLGKGGAKTVLKFVRPFTNKLPIIGGLLDFGLSIALGESIGRAAFKAIGATLLGAVGTAVGSVVPIAGNLIGGIAGAALGDWSGGALYDLFFGNKNNNTKTTQPEQKIEKYDEGGVTRGGKYISSTPQRIIKKKKITRSISPPTSSLQPGKSVGGNIKSKTDPSKPVIETFYPNKTGEKEVKPYKYLHSSHKNISKISYLGSLFGLVTKTIFGDRPSPIDYLNVSEGLNSWINTILGKLSLGYADGGLVDSDIGNQDLRNWLSITIQNTVNPRINQVINDLMKQLLLKPMTGPGGPNPSPPGGKSQTEDPNAQFQGQADFVIGDDVAHGFAGRSGNGTDTSDSKLGRKPSEILAILKAKGEELKGKLIDLSTGIAHSKDDWSIINEQLKYLQSIGAKVRLLGVGKQWDEKVGGNQVNSKLQQLASQYGAYFYGGHNASGDRTLGLQGSTQDYEEVKHKLESTAVSGGGPLGPGSGNIRFGRTGSLLGMAPGWAHSHFENLNGGMTSQSPTETNIKKLVQDVTPALKIMASRGLKPELARGEPILPGKDDAFYERLIRLGVSRHTHSGPKTAVDVNMPGFPKVPFALKDIKNTPNKGEGINALLANSNTTALFHLSFKPDGMAFHGKLITGNDPKLIKTHDGEFIVDKDSVDVFGLPFIELINRIESKSQLKNNIGKLMKMLDYEDERPQTIVMDVYEDNEDEPSYIVNNTNILSSSSEEDELGYLMDWV
jgi:hypothetical protein